MQDTGPLLTNTDFPPIARSALSTLQVNLGYLCNLSCTHCHVDAGPNRTELMDVNTIGLVTRVLSHLHIETLDLTGGSPEMNPHFCELVEQATSAGIRVLDRCNPTILVEPGFEHLPAFLADQQVNVIASLPCYSEQNVDKQRGKGVYRDSIHGLLCLNELGYGQPGSGLNLDLVYNPDEPTLPPEQAQLEDEYRVELRRQHGIEFNRLFVLANMPISRFGARLLAGNQFTDYMTLLRNSFEYANLENVMCRSLVSIDYQGYVFDCDFNQMLGLSCTVDERPLHLRDLLRDSGAARDLVVGREIVVGEHCYGCTAEQGSSCGGALST